MVNKSIQKRNYHLRNKMFYFLRPFIPRKLQIQIRQILALQIRRKCRDIWPIDNKSHTPPSGWKGWPEKKLFAFVLTHDVDTTRGISRCIALAEKEKEIGFVSTFNIVPERYAIPNGLVDSIKDMGFGIGVHGLKHDGKLFSSRERFAKRAAIINQYLKKWNTRGFSSPSMHHRLEWMNALDIDYSTATFDTDPFEPQPDGVGTIFPFRVKNAPSHKGFIELPYTMAQDFTLFVILKEKDPSIWIEKIDWIAKNGGMALINTHSDYMSFTGEKKLEEYPVETYLEFLRYVKNKYEGQFWHALTKDVASHCEGVF